MGAGKIQLKGRIPEFHGGATESIRDWLFASEQNVCMLVY